MIGGVAVTIPARDEEALLPSCLDSIRHAADALPGEIEVAIVVAADSCADATGEALAAVTAQDPRVQVVTGRWRRAGAARRAAADLATARLGGTARPAPGWPAPTPTAWCPSDG